MYPAIYGIRLDIDAVSGMMGSISIACWLVVFSPQIIENFRRSSAEGLSLSFLIIWLLGDLFNILGGIFQGVLPTMLILAVYYTLADIVLLAQVLYYNGIFFGGKPKKRRIDGEIEAAAENPASTEESPLLARVSSPESGRRANSPSTLAPPVHPNVSLALRRNSSNTSSPSTLYTNIDGVHLSPATPLLDTSIAATLHPRSHLRTTIFNVAAILIVCAAGMVGWFLAALRSQRSSYTQPSQDYSPPSDDLEFDALGQVFGYLCAVLYLGSRIPQLLLNFRRKSTEGVSMLFFLFACIGNLTYVLSIFAFEPACAKLGRRRDDWGVSEGFGHHEHGCKEGEWADVYRRYIFINLSWLVGSAGTLVLDAAVFAQFWLYRGNAPVTV